MMKQSPWMPSGFPMSNKYPGPAPYFKLPPQNVAMQPQTYKMQPPAKKIKLSTQVHQPSIQLQPATTQIRSPSMVTSTTTMYVLIII